MLPDSARELKALLSQRLSDAPLGSVLPRGAGDAEAYEVGGATRWSGVALGLAPVGPRSVHLAVRLVEEADAAAVLAGLDEAARAEVDVRVIGRVRPLSSPGSSPDELQQRVRPLRPGLSVGHPSVSAGTLGGFARVPGDDRLLVLSNNHVLAASDAATEGDAALQPGVADGGTLDDRIGVLSALVQLSPEPGNLVDAAVAALDPGVTADPAGYPGGALAALVAAVDDVDPDELVEKVGRTTGHTRGRITAVEVDGVGVQYDEGVVTFDDQVEVEGLTGGFSAGGDSGSVIWRSRDRAPLGLLFAGSTTGGAPAAGSPSPTRWPPCCANSGWSGSQADHDSGWPDGPGQRLRASSRAWRGPGSSYHGAMTDRAAARAAKSTLARRLAADPGVAAVGLARQDTEYVVRVDLTEAGAGSRVPRDVDGVRVVTHVIGTVRAL